MMNQHVKCTGVADEDDELDMLIRMGFDVTKARLALEANEGDVDAALDDLCSGKNFGVNNTKTVQRAAAGLAQPKEVPWQTYQQQEELARRKVGAPASNSNQECSEKALYHPGRATATCDSGIDPLAAPNRPCTKEGVIVSDIPPASPVGMKERVLVSNMLHDPNHNRVNPPVGAFAVSGAGRGQGDLEEGDYDPAYICDNSHLVTAHEVGNDDSYERTQSPMHPITATLVSPESYAASTEPSTSKEKVLPFWTRKRILLVALLLFLLVLAGCAVAGTLLALKDKEDDIQDSAATAAGTEDSTVNATGTKEPSVEATPPPPLATTQAPLATTQAPLGTTEDPRVYTDTIRARSNEGDRFAEFVVISRDGSTIASGAEVGNYVQVYRQSGTVWEQVGQTLKGSGGGDQFGKGVDLNQDGSMVIGGAWNNDGRAKNAGHARAFRLDGDEWKQVGQTLEGESEEDHFGWYVSMSDDGKTIAASAFSGDVDGNAEAGYVRVFALDDSGDKWVQLGDDLTGEKQFEQFGRAMAMSKDGRRLAVGSTRWNQETGIVRVFDFDYGKWSQVGRDLTGLAPGDWFGSGVALNADGNVIAIGADGVETGGNKAGLIRAFLLEGCCTWKQYGQDIVGPGDQGRLGMHQVALSDDGCCLVAGASHFNNNIGKGYMYSLSNNEWKQIVELSGDAVSDEFGESVSISGDGKVAVFGASEYETSRPGYFRVFYANHEKPC